ncbi:MAG TPA: PIN domain-containing protein [Candidatus Limnocylindria bacterium]|nr:PIN domain-containing protein [Candidatus Limnocylindria bacterium]
MAGVLVDAGPLVALLDRSDQHHRACAEASRTLRGPLVSVWPAVTEAMYLLGMSAEAQDALWDMIETRALVLASLDLADVPRMGELMRKYRDRPMDLADAALVRVAEREKIRTVFTVDRTDFEAYRPSRSWRFSIVP